MDTTAHWARRRRPAALATALAVTAALVPALATPAARPAPAPLAARTAAGLEHDHTHAEGAEAASSGAPGERGADDPTDFAFLSRTDPPARWDACDYVDWKVTLAGAPRDGFNLVVEAVRKVEAATGLRFRYLGESTFVPTRTQRTETGVDLSIAWVEADAPDVWSSTPAPAGIGGALWWGGHVDADGRSVPRIATGFVALEASSARREDAWLDALAVSPDGRDPAAQAARVLASRRQVVLHELGHALGLGHSTGSAQVMSPSATGVTDWAAGDRAGLQRLGASSGCLSRAQAEAQARQVPPALSGPELLPSAASAANSAPPAPAVEVPVVPGLPLPRLPRAAPTTDPAAATSGDPSAPVALPPTTSTATTPAPAPVVLSVPPTAVPTAAARPVPVSVRGPARVRRGALVVLTVRGRPGDAFAVHARRAGATAFSLARTGHLDRTGVARVSFRPVVDHRWYAAVGPARSRTGVGLTQVVR